MPRRRKEGQIERTEGGMWRARISVHGQKINSPACPTKQEAEAWRVELLRRKYAPSTVMEGGSRPTLTYGELVPELLAWYRNNPDRTFSPSTLANYRQELQRLERHWGTRRVAETRSRDVDDWIRLLRAGDLSSSTIRHLLDRLSALHQYAVRREYLLDVPCTIRRPTWSRVEPVMIMSEPEVDRLIAEAAVEYDVRALAVACLCADAGLRRSECALLRAEDVDLEVGVIHLRNRGRGDQPKGGKPRSIPILTRRLREALERVPARSDRRMLGVTSSKAIQGLICEPWRRAFPDRWHVRLHALRHRFVSYAQACGVPPAIVQAMVGHGTLQTTGLYTHMDPSQVPAGARRAFDGEAKRARARPAPGQGKTARAEKG